MLWCLSLISVCIVFFIHGQRDDRLLSLISVINRLKNLAYLQTETEFVFAYDLTYLCLVFLRCQFERESTDYLPCTTINFAERCLRI